MSDGWLPPRSPTLPPAGGPTGPRPSGGSNTQPTVALGLASTSLVLTLVSAGLLFLITMPLAVAGWVLGRRALARVRDGGDGREGTAKAARFIGIAATTLNVVALVTWTTLMAIDDTIIDDLERELEDLEDEGRGGSIVTRLTTVAGLRLTGLLTG